MATLSRRCFLSGIAQKVRPSRPTEFDLEVARLNLGPEPRNWVTSPPLRYWVMRHRTRRYVPEILLKQWGMELSDREAVVG